MWGWPSLFIPILYGPCCIHVSLWRRFHSCLDRFGHFRCCQKQGGNCEILIPGGHCFVIMFCSVLGCGHAIATLYLGFACIRFIFFFTNFRDLDQDTEHMCSVSAIFQVFQQHWLLINSWHDRRRYMLRRPVTRWAMYKEVTCKPGTNRNLWRQQPRTPESVTVLRPPWNHHPVHK